MRKIQMLVVVIALCFLCNTGLAQSKRRSQNKPLSSWGYRAKRIPWKGPTEIKAVNMRLLATLYGDVSNPNGIAVPDDVIQNYDLSPDGNTLVCTYFTAALVVWDTQTGRRKKIIELAKAGFGDVAFSPDGTMFVTTPGNMTEEQESRSIRFWDAKTYKVKAKIDVTGRVQAIKFSPDGKSLAVVSYIEDSGDGKTIVELWDVQSKKLAAVQPAKGRSIDGSALYVMSQIAFSPDGSKLATITKKTVEVWDVKTGEVVQTLQSPEKDVTGVWFSPDGRFLVSTGEQQPSEADKAPVGELIIWNALDGQKVKTLPGYTYATFSPDGKLIASGNREGEDYSLIDVSTGMVISHFPQIGALRFSRNGKRAASYDDLVVIRTWQVLK
jgi:WD40 repeat protein